MLRVGPLVIDRAGRVATVGDRPLNLTRRELTVLEILAARPERIIPKEELVEQLFNFDQEASLNAVEQFVARLRRKLADAPIEIRTLRGLGYQLAAH
jgi:two-component system response regulator TctD